MIKKILLLTVIIFSFSLDYLISAERVHFTIENRRVDGGDYLFDLYADVPDPSNVWRVAPETIVIKYNIAGLSAYDYDGDNVMNFDSQLSSAGYVATQTDYSDGLVSLNIVSFSPNIDKNDYFKIGTIKLKILDDSKYDSLAIETVSESVIYNNFDELTFGCTTSSCWKATNSSPKLINICSEEPTDTDGNGYRNISTLCHLRWVSENDSSWTWNFELDNDINADTTQYWNSNKGMIPIGRSNKPFRGTFLGQGFKISKLTVKPINLDAGLFGFADSASISGLFLENCDVIGSSGNASGALIGNCFETNVKNCGASGNVEGGTRVGGLIGQIIWFSGFLPSEIKNSYSNCNVKAIHLVGGFVGFNATGNIYHCYSTGSVMATDTTNEAQAGGFVGFSSRTITNCYSTGDVNGKKVIGGFVGNIGDWSNLQKCYSVGELTGLESVGGLVGKKGTNSQIISSCWDTQTSGIDSSAGGTGKTTIQMKTQSTFVNWDFDSTWSISSQVNDGYPYLQGFEEEEQPGNFAFYFDGTNDYITTKLMAGYNEHQVMTWELLVKPTRFDHNERQTLISCDNGYYDRTMLLEEDNKLSAFDGDDSWHAIKADSNRWQHFAVVYAKDSIVLYKNGVRIVNDFLDNNTSYTFFEIAHNPGYNEKFQGYIDEVRIWNGMRTQQQIIDNINREIENVNDSNLIAYYNFNNFSIDSLFDEKGLHNGKIVGTPEAIPLNIDTILINPSQLIQPKINEITELIPEFSWLSITDADKYSIIISSDSTFSTYIVKDTSLSLPSYQIESEKLLSNQKYYWKVTLNLDGKQYPWSSTWFFNTKEDSDTVLIGNQVWMKRNLDVAVYRNGDTIPHIQNPSDWINATSGAWCYYNNDPENGKIYGKLYNWYAVNDPRGLAPNGWRIPNDQDWKELEMELGMTQQEADSYSFRGSPVGAKIAGGYDLWSAGALRNDSNFNSSGFEGLPSGYRYYVNGSFDYLGYYTFWWTSNTGIYRGLNNSVTSVSRNNSSETFGFPVRCIKDSVNDPIFEPILVSPADLSTNQDIDLTLTWNSVSNATSYQVQLSKTSDLSTTIIDAIETDTTILVNNLDYSSTYYWHVRAMNSSDTSDWSDVWSFTTKSAGVIEPPSSWDFTDFTGSNSTVVILKNINPKIENRDFQNGDAIGFFYKRNDSLICAGYGVWNNANLAVTVWGDDSETALKDGFANIEGYTIKIWDGQLGRELNVEVTYSSGNSYFVDDAISYIGFLKGVSSITQNIYIAKGWNMISSFVNPTNDSLEVMFDDISNNLTILKNNAGQVFIPSYDINGIGKWNIEHGYKAYMSSSDTLKVTGLALKPENKPIVINFGWNIVSYIRSSAKDVSECLTTLTESASLTIAKNNAGQVYIPSYDINSIGNMLPGQGYQMYLSAKDTLIYPANSAGRSSSNQLTPMPKYILPEYSETGNSAVLVIEIAGANGDEVAVYNNKEEIIGSGVIYKNKVAVTIWGDNERTNEIEGSISSEKLKVKSYNVKSGRFSDITLSNIYNVVDDNLENNLNYKQDAIYFAKGKIEDNSNKLSLNVTPNPANDFIEITIEGENNNSTLKLFTNTGKLISDISTELNSMSGNKIRFNTNNLPSGSYNLILTSDNNKLMKQIIIIK